MDICSVGQKLHDSCHQLHFNRTTGLKKIHISDFQLLQKRTSVEAEVLSKIVIIRLIYYEHVINLGTIILATSSSA